MNEEDTPTRGERMQSKFRTAVTLMEKERLPGWEAFFVKNAEAEKWVSEKEGAVRASIRDEDEVLFERALGSWTMGWERVNHVLAEEYRATNKDPETWELRYIKWMKIAYIKFGGPIGTFYLVPRKSRRRPRVEHWYTVDEMLDMLHPTNAAAIKTFNTLPVRPDSLEGPGPGEKHLHVDLTGPEMRVTGKLHNKKRGRRG